MLVAGETKEINISGGAHQHNKYKVAIDLFRIPGDMNSSKYVYEANCAVPGNYGNLYNVGDKVYVAFLNGDRSLPVILGKIYQGLSEDFRGYANVENLKIKSSAELPINTQVGDYSYSEIAEYFTTIQLMSTMIEDLQIKVAELEAKIESHLSTTDNDTR